MSAPYPLRRLGTLALLGALGLLSACNGRGNAADKGKEEANKAPPVLELDSTDLAIVSRAPVRRTLPLSGSLMPLVQATVKAKTSGEVLELPVREGQSVKRGALLVRLDTRLQQATVASQRAALEKARADAALAKLNLDNNRRLLDKHFIAQNVLDTAQSTFDAASAGVRAAEAQLRLAEIGIDDAAVRAPFDGVIARRLVQPGEKVSPDTPLLALVDLRQLEMQASAPASEIPAIHPGQRATLTVDGFAGRPFSARVERINPVAEQGSRAITIYLALDNADGQLKGGMFARGELALDAGTPTLNVPISALHEDESPPYVFAIDNGKVQQARVSLGARSSDGLQVAIASGLNEGTTVVATHIAGLKAGMTVRAPQPAPAQP